MKREVRKRERRMCSEKITISKDVCSGEMDTESSPMCTVEICIDFQLDREDSLRSFPSISSPSLNPTFSNSDYLFLSSSS